MKALALKWQVSGNRYHMPVPSDRWITIGRYPSCDIVLGDLYVSRRHAAVVSKNGKLVVHVLSTTNPIIINNIHIADHDFTAALMPGDAFRLGQVNFLVGHVEAKEDGEEEPSAMPVTCPSCGNELSGDISTCGNCGTALGAEETLLQARATTRLQQ